MKHSSLCVLLSQFFLLLCLLRNATTRGADVTGATTASSTVEARSVLQSHALIQVHIRVHLQEGLFENNNNNNNNSSVSHRRLLDSLQDRHYHISVDEITASASLPLSLQESVTLQWSIPSSPTNSTTGSSWLGQTIYTALIPFALVHDDNLDNNNEPPSMSVRTLVVALWHVNPLLQSSAVLARAMLHVPRSVQSHYKAFSQITLEASITTPPTITSVGMSNDDSEVAHPRTVNHMRWMWLAVVAFTLGLLYKKGMRWEHPLIGPDNDSVQAHVDDVQLDDEILHDDDDHDELQEFDHPRSTDSWSSFQNEDEAAGTPSNTTGAAHRSEDPSTSSSSASEQVLERPPRMERRLVRLQQGLSFEAAMDEMDRIYQSPPPSVLYVPAVLLQQQQQQQQQQATRGMTRGTMGDATEPNAAATTITTTANLDDASHAWTGGNQRMVPPNTPFPVARQSFFTAAESPPRDQLVTESAIEAEPLLGTPTGQSTKDVSGEGVDNSNDGSDLFHGDASKRSGESSQERSSVTAGRRAVPKAGLKRCRSGTTLDSHAASSYSKRYQLDGFGGRQSHQSAENDSMHCDPTSPSGVSRTILPGGALDAVPDTEYDREQMKDGWETEAVDAETSKACARRAAVLETDFNSECGDSPGLLQQTVRNAATTVNEEPESSSSNWLSRLAGYYGRDETTRATSRSQTFALENPNQGLLELTNQTSQHGKVAQKSSSSPTSSYVSTLPPHSGNSEDQPDWCIVAGDEAVKTTAAQDTSIHGLSEICDTNESGALLELDPEALVQSVRSPREAEPCDNSTARRGIQAEPSDNSTARRRISEQSSPTSHMRRTSGDHQVSLLAQSPAQDFSEGQAVARADLDSEVERRNDDSELFCAPDGESDHELDSTRYETSRDGQEVKSKRFRATDFDLTLPEFTPSISLLAEAALLQLPTWSVNGPPTGDIPQPQRITNHSHRRRRRKMFVGDWKLAPTQEPDQRTKGRSGSKTRNKRRAASNLKAITPMEAAKRQENTESVSPWVRRVLNSKSTSSSLHPTNENSTERKQSGPMLPESKFDATTVDEVNGETVAKQDGLPTAPDDDWDEHEPWSPAENTFTAPNFSSLACLPDMTPSESLVAAANALQVPTWQVDRNQAANAPSFEQTKETQKTAPSHRVSLHNSAKRASISAKASTRDRRETIKSDRGFSDKKPTIFPLSGAKRRVEESENHVQPTEKLIPDEEILDVWLAASARAPAKKRARTFQVKRATRVQHHSCNFDG